MTATDVDEVLSEAQTAAPKANAVTPVKPVKAAPAPELDPDGALPEPPSMRVAMIPPVPPKRPGVVGLPDPEQDPEVVAVRANYSRLSQELQAAVAERSVLETELGVPLGASGRTLDKLALNLLAIGGSDADVERLKALASRESRLVGACVIACRRVGELLAEARRKLTGEVVELLHKPAARKVALQALAFLAAMKELRLADDAIQAAGHGRPDGLFHQLDSSTTGQNPDVSHMVRNLGLLSPAEVAAALPGLVGY